MAATPLLHRLARNSLLLGWLPGHASPASGPAFSTVVEDERMSLLLFLWPGGAWTPMHDHTSWGVYVCVAGRLVEDRYTRLDDGTQAGTARLRREWRAAWEPGQSSTLMPYAGGMRPGQPGRPRGSMAWSHA